MADLNTNVDSFARRAAQIAEIIEQRLRNSAAGDATVDKELIDAHPELMPELAEELRKLRVIDLARQQAEGINNGPARNEVEIAATIDSPLGGAQAKDLTDRNVSATVVYTPWNGVSSGNINTDGDARVTPAGERYQKLHSHAMGGLGEVFVAHDEQLNRTVALKELQRRHAHDPLIKARFLLEGEVTGSLEHPGIVPVYSMGQDETGRPFYTMRFIRGQSMREAIRRFHREARGRDAFSRNSLEFRRLLGQFIGVCNAVAFAHDRGVLHRDMKPENVMLGDFGETLVVDWGMARVRGQSVTGDETQTFVIPVMRNHGTLTEYGSALGTPAYMSPEVASGKAEQWGPGIDVFSLGATLYCLLTKRPPYREDKLSELMIKAERCDYTPPHGIDPRVPRPLSAICCRAMALEPKNRYPTPLELAGDIERWLGDEAVSAYRDRRAERVFRWVRRHRTWAMAGAASIVIVGVISIVAAGLINRARERAVALADANAQLAKSEAAARAEAIRRFAESRQTVDTWLTGFSEAVQYYPGVQNFRDRMLEQAAQNYSEFSQKVSNDPDLELERGRTLMRLGDLRRNLYQADAAKDAYAKAAAVFTKLNSGDSKNPTALLENANVTAQLGILAADLGSYDEAVTLYETALRELESLGSTNVDQQRLKASLVRAEVAFGALLAFQGTLEAAEAHLRRAIELQTELVRATPGAAQLTVPLAVARIKLGQVFLERGASHGALNEFSQAITYWDRLVELQPDHPEPRESRAIARINLAGALRLLGRYQAEADAYRGAIADYNALQDATPDVRRYREQRAHAETDLGQTLYELGRAREAVELLTKVKVEMAPLAESSPEFVESQQLFAVCLDNLGQAQHDLNQFAAALASHNAALEIYERLAREAPEELAYQERCAVCRSHIGQVQASMGDATSGVASMQAAAEQLETIYDLRPDLASAGSALATVRGRIGDAFADTMQSEHAGSAYLAASRTWKEVLEKSPSAEYLHRAAAFETMCPIETRDSGAGLDYARRAVDAAPENRFYLGTLAAARVRAREFQQANDLFPQLLESEEADRGRDLLFFALCQAKLERPGPAKETLARAAEWIAEHRPGNPQLNRLRAEVAQLLNAGESASNPPDAPNAD